MARNRKADAPDSLPRADLNKLYHWLRAEYPHHFRVDGRLDKPSLKAFVLKETGNALDHAGASGNRYADYYRYCRKWMRRSMDFMGWEPDQQGRKRSRNGRDLAGDGVDPIGELLKGMLH